ncbi:MAG TPA: helix-turn-helix transcriptional regulator [Pseudonocardiaceae bacterium]|jgi:transcriptional regulator with XRE-family HTH domain|nr:helix-turn-helix transcriptional regulator [Pseudonocardiaceae bacterium]
MPADTGCPRLRELRIEAGWTQQQLTDKLAYLAWALGQGHVAVNADMVAKWERGVKGISPRYRALLCQLFGVTAEQLGVSPAVSAVPSRPVRDAESLVSMLDDVASLLDQLGAAGTALAPQMLSAWKDTVTTRRTMFGLLDPAATDPAGHARATTATLADLEQLAERYLALHATADPAALLTPVAAHVRMVTAALGRDHTTAERRRLLRNRATVATLAGRLAYEDLADALSGRAYYGMALDSAREAEDHQAAATALGYTAQLAHADGMTTAALDHLAAALAHAERAPAIGPWLASIVATIHADSGDHTAAADTLRRAESTASQPATLSCLLFDYGPAHLAAATGHVLLRAGDHSGACKELTAALDQLPPTARRARVLALADLAMAELHAGHLLDACRHATTAADLLHRVPYATGATRLRAFRAAAARPLGPRALRFLDEHLAHLAA